MRFSKRTGFSLIELLLALALTAMVTVLLGQLMQNYIAQSEGPVERMIQDQEARKILTLISDDLRGVVRNQTFDAAALQQILSSGKGGSQQGGGGSTTTTTTTTTTQMSTGQGSGPPTSGLTTSTSMTTGESSSTAQPSQSSNASSSTTAAAYPPGVYGTSTALELDVSRIPRPDQYFAEQSAAQQGKLADITSDTKTVSYFVQAPTTTGVDDPLSSTATGAGGLIRRQIDRAINKWANEQGQSQLVNRTGEILSTSVVSIEFAYFNGTQWSYSWDSSVEGLPWAIEITVAMQDPIKARDNPISPGTDLTSMDASAIAELGVRTYSSTVSIPGASLLSVPQATQSASGDTGMGAMGL